MIRTAWRTPTSMRTWRGERYHHTIRRCASSKNRVSTRSHNEIIKRLKEHLTPLGDSTVFPSDCRSALTNPTLARVLGLHYSTFVILVKSALSHKNKTSEFSSGCTIWANTFTVYIGSCSSQWNHRKRGIQVLSQRQRRGFVTSIVAHPSI